MASKLSHAKLEKSTLITEAERFKRSWYTKDPLSGVIAEPHNFTSDVGVVLSKTQMPTARSDPTKPPFTIEHMA